MAENVELTPPVVLRRRKITSSGASSATGFGNDKEFGRQYPENCVRRRLSLIETNSEATDVDLSCCTTRSLSHGTDYGFPVVLRRRKITSSGASLATGFWKDKEFGRQYPENCVRRRLSLIETKSEATVVDLRCRITKSFSHGTDYCFPVDPRPESVRAPARFLNYKVLVVGEVSGGKSSLIKRYVHNFYSELNAGPTIGIDFKLKLIPYEDDTEIRLQLWDVGGQCAPMTRSYYRGAHGAIIVFDQTNRSSFLAAFDRWKAELDAKCSLPGFPPNRPLPVILAANKSDLHRSPDIPDDLEISQMVQERGFVPTWFQCSAKTGEGVHDLANLLIKYIMTLDTWSNVRRSTVILDDVSPSSDERPPKTTNPSSEALKTSCSC